MLYPKVYVLKCHAMRQFGTLSLSLTICAFGLSSAAQGSGHAEKPKAHAAQSHAQSSKKHTASSEKELGAKAHHVAEAAQEKVSHAADHIKHKSKSFLGEITHSFDRLYDLVLGSYVKSFWQKLDHIRKVDEQNERLIKKLALLEMENATIKKGTVERKEAGRSQSLKKHATLEGGVPEARTLASLETADPNLLSQEPRKIYEGAMAAFVEEDYATAAKAFLHLTESPETTDYSTAETNYFAALSLYNLHNYKQALRYFEYSYKQAKGEEVTFAPRAMAWIAVCQKKLGRSVAGQTTVKELIEKFPRSKEAQRLNRNE